MKQPFLGFTFNGKHSSRFNVIHISEGDFYNETMFGEPSDSTDTVVGKDGVYFFGTDIKAKPRELRCYVKGIDENIYRELKAWLSPMKMGQLIMDETPYKYSIVKISGSPEFEFVPYYRNTLTYSGFFTIPFVAYDPYSYSFYNTLEEYEYDNEELYYDSGILYANFKPPNILTNITSNTDIILYNGGNARSRARVYITGTWGSLTIKNKTTNQSFTLNENAIQGTYIVDAIHGRTTLGDNQLANSIHEGSYIELEGTNKVDEYPDVLFTNGSDVVTNNSGEWDDDIVGRYLAIGDNQWYKVISKESDTDITIDREYEGNTDNKYTYCIDLNELEIAGENLDIIEIKFEYKFTYY